VLVTLAFATKKFWQFTAYMEARKKLGWKPISTGMHGED
jgi:hypothetical protein